MKVLITGSTGFLGLALSKHLSKKGWKPRLMVRRPQRGALLETLDAEIVQADLGSYESLVRACKGVEGIVHMGARAIFEEYDLVKPTIVDGTERLLKAAEEAGVKYFVYASSLLVYESQEAEIDAKTLPNPQCGYGVAKLEAEKILQKSSMELAILRLPHVYGPMDLMFEEIRKGRVTYPGNGKNLYSHMHVEDCCRLIEGVIEKKWIGCSPVADNLPVNWIDYFDTIRTYYPSLKVHRIPEWLALFFTYVIYPFRRMRSRPSVYTPGSVISWNLNLPVKKGLIWDEIGIEPKYPSVFQGLPFVLDDCIPFRWIHPIHY